VQSDETRRKLGELDRELTEQRIRAMARMHAEGDLDGLFAHVAEDVVFDLRGSSVAFPYPKAVRGKEQALRAVAMIAVHFEHLGSVIHDLIIDGEKVAVRRTATVRHRGTGKIGEVEIADFISLRDGLVYELVEIADSEAMAALENG
jgi:ketosteroid isomerase-like protein